jgi:hypothetical protein
MAKAGALTKYNKKYCEELIDHMEKGYSFESFAGTIRICKSTLYNWEKVNKDFAQAKAVGIDLSRLFWETQSIEGLYSEVEFNEKGLKISEKKINATVLIFNMKNRFPQEWREKQPGEEDQININLSLAEEVAKARARAKKN